LNVEKRSLDDFRDITESFPDELQKDLEYINNYKIIFEQINIENFYLKYIRPVNFDTILDDYVEKYNDADYIPYWAEFWPSCHIMASEILDKYNFNNDEVLELGSGNGISGLSIPLKNGEIIYSDYDPNSYPFIRINHFLNHSEIPKVLKLDWTQNKHPNKYNWLIASDLAYEKRLYGPLIQSMNKLLTPSGKILLTEPERSFASPFFTLLKENGFNYTKKLLDAKNLNKDITIGFYEIFKMK